MPIVMGSECTKCNRSPVRPRTSERAFLNLNCSSAKLTALGRERFVLSGVNQQRSSGCADCRQVRCDTIFDLRLRCDLAVSVIMLDRWSTVALCRLLFIASLAAADQPIQYEDPAAVAPYYPAGNSLFLGQRRGGISFSPHSFRCVLGGFRANTARWTLRSKKTARRWRRRRRIVYIIPRRGDTAAGMKSTHPIALSKMHSVPTIYLSEHPPQPPPVDMRGTGGRILFCKVGRHREGDSGATPLLGGCD